MHEAKTKPTTQNVADFLNAIEDEGRRKDCQTLAKLMQRVTGCKPQLWGPSIVGFDQYHYVYASGHSGDACVIGFAPRKGDLSLYLSAGFDGADTLLAKLGKHKVGKACLYLKRLEDVDMAVLEALLSRAVVDMKARYPAAP